MREVIRVQNLYPERRTRGSREDRRFQGGQDVPGRTGGHTEDRRSEKVQQVREAIIKFSSSRENVLLLITALSKSSRFEI